MDPADAKSHTASAGTPNLVGRQGLLRELNHRAVLEHLAQAGPTSRAELAATLGLSRPSVTRLVEAMLGVGLVLEGERVSSGAGRRSVLLGINPDAALVVGASVRPKRLRLTVADLGGGIRSQLVEPTETGDAAVLAAQVARLAAAARAQAGLAEHRVAAAAIGITAAWDERGSRLHAAPNLPQVEGVDMRALLRTALTETFGKPMAAGAVVVDNDVNLAALGEKAVGVASERSSFFYLSLGSGVGGATVVHGRVHAGEHGFAGEVGYLPVVEDGRTVLLEDVVSRGALGKQAQRLGLGDDAAHLLEAAASGHEDAGLVVARVGAHLSTAITAITTTLDPQCIVIGGSVGRFAETLVPAIERSMPARLPVPCEIVGTALRGDASLLGAVHLARGLAREALIEEDLR